MKGAETGFTATGVSQSVPFKTALLKSTLVKESAIHRANDLPLKSTASSVTILIQQPVYF